MQGGGTGATTPGGITAGLGLKTMAYQDSNNVNITGGVIESPGLGVIVCQGDIWAYGKLITGSAHHVITNSEGRIIEGFIDNIANIAHINQNEVVSGSWTFNGGTLTVNVPANFNSTAAFVGNINALGGVSTPQLTMSVNLPQIWLTDLDGAVDAKHFRIAHEANQVNFNFYNDTIGAAATALYFDHSAWTPTRVGMNASNRVEIGTPHVQLVSPGQSGNVIISFNSAAATSKGLEFYGAGARTGQVVMNGGAMYNDAEAHYWRNGSGGTLLASMGNDGRFIPSGLTTTNNEAWYAKGYSHVRIHIKEESRPAGQMTYCLMNYGAALAMIATSDDGGSPVGADWYYSLSVYRDGMVKVGGGGFLCDRVMQGGKGLNWGSWLPTDAGSIANITQLQIHTSRWSRVGNIVTVSCKFDAATAATGTNSWVRLFLPLYTIYGSVSGNDSTAAGWGSGTGTNDEPVWCNCPSSSGHVDIQWISKSTGLHGFHITYVYTTT